MFQTCPSIWCVGIFLPIYICMLKSRKLKRFKKELVYYSFSKIENKKGILRPIVSFNKLFKWPLKLTFLLNLYFHRHHMQTHICKATRNKIAKSTKNIYTNTNWSTLVYLTSFIHVNCTCTSTIKCERMNVLINKLSPCRIIMNRKIKERHHSSCHNDKSFTHIEYLQRK